MEKFRGVYAHKEGGWTATIGKCYLGWFRTHEEASQARISAEIERYGQQLERKPVEIHGDIALIPLHGRGVKFYGYAKIDADDLPIVEPTSWTVDGRGYVVGRPPQSERPVTLHRWLTVGLDKGGAHTDHVNRDKLDNRRSNLRQCTQKQNARNTRIASNNSTGFKGVRKTKAGRWVARITVDRKHIYIGTYSTIEEAAAAYDAAALIMHMEFASPNSLIKQ